MQPMQVTITLDGRTSAALRQEAMRQLRRPKDQAAILLRQALGIAEDQQVEVNATNKTQNDAGRIRQDLASAVL